VGKGQLQGAIRALIAARGGTPPGSVNESVEQMQGHLTKAWRRLRALQGVQHGVNGEEQLIRAAYSRGAAAAAPAAAGTRTRAQLAPPPLPPPPPPTPRSLPQPAGEPAAPSLPPPLKRLECGQGDASAARPGGSSIGESGGEI
jgi:hypothetical protein